MAYPENFNKNQFVETFFIDVPEPNNPPPGFKDLTPDELNKLGTGIADNRESLHLAFIPLVDNALSAKDPLNSYPKSSESLMSVDSTIWPEAEGAVYWPEDQGIVKTVNHKTAYAVGDLLVGEIPYNYQEFKGLGTYNKYYRYALTFKDDLAQWTPNTTYIAGQVVYPTINNGIYYRTVAGGQSQGIEPVWPTTGTVDETDINGAVTVTWEVAGRFWSGWEKVVTTADTASSIGAAPTESPTFTGTLVNTPDTQNVALAADQINPTSKTILVNNTSAAALSLSSTPSVIAGVDGQEIEITNQGTLTIGLSDRATVVGSGLMLGATSRVLGPGDTLKLKYLTAFADATYAGYWVETGFTNTL